MMNDELSSAVLSTLAARKYKQQWDFENELSVDLGVNYYRLVNLTNDLLTETLSKRAVVCLISWKYQEVVALR